MGSVGQTMHAMPPIMIFQCSQRHRIVNMVRINHHCIITQKIPFQQVIGKIRRTKMTNSKQSKSLKLLYFASKAFKNCSIIIKLRLMIHFFFEKKLNIIHHSMQASSMQDTMQKCVEILFLIVFSWVQFEKCWNRIDKFIGYLKYGSVMIFKIWNKINGIKWCRVLRVYIYIYIYYI